VGLWMTLSLGFSIPAIAHDIPNQRVDRSIQVTVSPAKLRIDYEISLSELTLTQDLRSLIGSLPGADRQEWLKRFGEVTGPLNAKGFFIAVDRLPVALEYKAFDLTVEEHPRYTFQLETRLPESGRLEIYDTNYATSEGTSRLAIRGRDGVEVSGDRLPTEVDKIPVRPVWDLTDEEELRSKRVVVNYASSVAKPAAAIAIQSEETSAKVDSQGERKGSTFSFRLRDFLDRNEGKSLAGMLLIAGLLGAAHSLQPGHGKSLVTAVALRKGARWYHPLVLGLATSVTHTGSVLVVAAGIWLTGTAEVENLHLVLVRVAGLMIGLIGFWRLGRFLGGFGEHHDETPTRTSELPGTLELVGLGFFGGLVPCWDAVGLIVLATALGRLGLGILCVIAFGTGMAVILMAVGLLASRFWSAFFATTTTPRLERWLGVGTSLVLVTIGLTLFLESS